MERTVSDAGREFARQLSRVGESVDNASLFSAFEAQSEESDGVFDDGEAAGKAAGKAAALAREASAAGASKTTKESEPKAAAGRHAKKHILLDKLNFTLGIFNLAFSCLWIGKAPQSFYIAYTVKSVLLLGARFSYYRKQNLHYYFFDFCYLVNALLLLHCWVPQLRCIKWLWEALFACCAGPLAWSIPALRNSLVLHDFEKTTSLFMHWSPVAVVWTLRWYPIEGHPMSMEETAQASIFEIVVPATLLYTTWCIGTLADLVHRTAEKLRTNARLRPITSRYLWCQRRRSRSEATIHCTPT